MRIPACTKWSPTSSHLFDTVDSARLLVAETWYCSYDLGKRVLFRRSMGLQRGDPAPWTLPVRNPSWGSAGLLPMLDSDC